MYKMFTHITKVNKLVEVDCLPYNTLDELTSISCVSQENVKQYIDSRGKLTIFFADIVDKNSQHHPLH